MPAHLCNLDLTLKWLQTIIAENRFVPDCWCSYRSRLCDSLNLLTERFEMPVIIIIIIIIATTTDNEATSN